MHLLPSLLALVVSKAHAASPYYSLYCEALGTYCGSGEVFISQVAAALARVLVVPTIGGIAVISVLWASIKMMSSFGDDQGKEDAKKIITGGVVGIVLAITGAAVVHWVCLLVQMSVDGGAAVCG